MNKFEQLMQAQARPQPNAVVMATPFNDTQTIAIMAAILHPGDGMTCNAAVSTAIDILVEAIQQTKTLVQRVNKLNGA